VGPRPRAESIAAKIQADLSVNGPSTSNEIAQRLQRRQSSVTSKLSLYKNLFEQVGEGKWQLKRKDED